MHQMAASVSLPVRPSVPGLWVFPTSKSLCLWCCRRLETFLAGAHKRYRRNLWCRKGSKRLGPLLFLAAVNGEYVDVYQQIIEGRRRPSVQIWGVRTWVRRKGISMRLT